MSISGTDFFMQPEQPPPKYAERNGGYTRMYKVGPRRGDGAEVVILELV